MKETRKRPMKRSKRPTPPRNSKSTEQEKAYKTTVTHGKIKNSEESLCRDSKDC